MKRLIYLFFFALLARALPACADFPASLPTTAPATSQPYSGVTYREEVRKDPPEHLHVVTVDLTNPHLHLLVRKGGDDPDGPGIWQTTLQTVRLTAEKNDLDLAVNGDFFMGRDFILVGGREFRWYAGNWGQCVGNAMSDGQLWSLRPGRVSLVVDEAGKVSIGRWDKPPAGARQIVAGSHLLVIDGKPATNSKDAAPRTAAGVTKDGHTLVLLVVDGRRPDYSAGFTLGELANEMVALGCDTALNLDGGGSSTLVLRDPDTNKLKLMNRPSDGHDLAVPLSIERAVANVLGVKVDRPATREAKGN